MRKNNLFFKNDFILSIVLIWFLLFWSRFLNFTIIFWGLSALLNFTNSSTNLLLVDLYLIISKKEALIFELIYHYHGSDTWEDIFRDYNSKYLEDKKNGVEIAINEIAKDIKSTER